MTLPLPRAQSTYVDNSGRPTTEFYKWLQSLERDAGGDNTALALAIRQIAEKLGSVDGSVAGIPDVYPGLSADTSLVGIGGQIQVSGTLASGEALVGLASLADSGAGELLAVERDAFGRVSGTRSVLPSDIPSPLWTFLVDPDGNYLTDADGALLRAPGYHLDEDVFVDGTVTATGGFITPSGATAFSTPGGGEIDSDPSGATIGIRAGSASVAALEVSRSNGVRIALLGDAGTSDAVFDGNVSPSGGGQSMGSSSQNWSSAYSTAFYSGASQVVGARNTGWSAMTGTGSKATIAASPAGIASAIFVPLELQSALDRIAALEARMKALDDALFAHGLIGT